MNRKILALGRLKAGVMNSTESAYAGRLEALKLSGAILWYKFEGVTFKLAHDTRYTPDFAVMVKSGEMEFHEVKGFWRDDAKIKIKVASELFPFRFIAAKKQTKKAGGGWAFEVF